MNRAIKFRAWLNYEQKYVIPVAIYFAENIEPTKIDYIEDGELKSAISGQFELEQDTGLKDKNSKKIYEGDIVGIKWNYYRIAFDGKYGWFGLSEIPMQDKVAFSDTCQIMPYLKDNSGEVIGNIHESTELLGGTNVTNIKNN